MSEGQKARSTYEPPAVEDYGQIHEMTKMPHQSKVGGTGDTLAGRDHPGQGSGVLGH